jgi:hypothetical protein
VNINVLRFAHQVAKHDAVGPSTRQLLVVEETLEPIALKFDIWERFVFALNDATSGRDQFAYIHCICYQ